MKRILYVVASISLFKHNGLYMVIFFIMVSRRLSTSTDVSSSFIIDWFTDPPMLSFGKLKKIENLCFLFSPILIFILIMNWNMENN